MAETNTKYILIVGGTGNVGSKIVKHLSNMIDDNTIIRVGSRNPSSERASKLQELPKVEVVQASLDDADSIVQAAQGCEIVYFNPYSSPQKGHLIADAINKLSDDENLNIKMFGQTAGWIGPFKDEVDSNGIYATNWWPAWNTLNEKSNEEVTCFWFELPLFTSNIYQHLTTIKNEGKIYEPCIDEARRPIISTDDAGRAIATILANPDQYMNTSQIATRYYIQSDFISGSEMAQVLSEVLGKPIEYVRQTYQEATAHYLNAGWPQHLVDGLWELYKWIDEAHEANFGKQDDDYTLITGLEPTSFRTWAEQNKEEFL